MESEAPMSIPVKPLPLDDLLPDPHFREHHERWIAAPPAAVWDALHDVRLVDLTLSRTLMALRALPARLQGQPRPRMVSARLLEEGPVPVLASDCERSVIAGGVMQPWKLAGAVKPPVLDLDGLRDFDEPGWVKTTMDFVLEPESVGTRLRTETRVRATDARTRARFGLYWLLPPDKRFGLGGDVEAAGGAADAG